MFMERSASASTRRWSAVGARAPRRRRHPPYNIPTHRSHPPDRAWSADLRGRSRLIGYAAVKGHWLDIGGRTRIPPTRSTSSRGRPLSGVKLYDRASSPPTSSGSLSPIPARAELVLGDINASRLLAHRRRRRRAPGRALRLRGLRELGRAHVRPRRSRRPELLREDPDGRYTATASSTTTASTTPRFRSRSRSRCGDRRCASNYSNAPAHRNYWSSSPELRNVDWSAYR